MNQRLDQMPSGVEVTVQRIDAADIGVQRLMAMGLCVGRRLEVVRHGNPQIIRLLGARIGLSNRIAQHILVEQVNGQ